MSVLIVPALLIPLVLALSATRSPQTDAVAAAGFAARVRACGWWSPLYAICGFLAVSGLAVGAGVLALLDVAAQLGARTASGLFVVLQAIHEHLSDLTTSRLATPYAMPAGERR
ncbi:hypothetical protein ACFWYW_58565 [Nonomuraea sp. NPDC059023]|uniref:hypothetical protein n=1 Tax=unclassified Nonomuraea TaxID=2593643 RepID=UPI0036BE49D4